MSSHRETRCPKCQYQRTEGDRLVLASICPACGIVYARFNDDANLTSKENDFTEHSTTELLAQQRERRKPWSAWLFSMPKYTNTQLVWGYALLYLLFFVWGWLFILSGIDATALMGSFMHNVNLPFHEFGHILFIPFGRFMSILGGSLFQLLMPLIVSLVFLLKKRDPFAASITFWWLGQSFIDLSPYIADATYRALPLIAGMGEEAHDWGNLLTHLGWLEYDIALAKTSFFIGSLIIITSLVWGGVVLKKMFAARH